MTDQYAYNPDIHDEWQPPAHRCENCRHVVPGSTTTTYEDGTTVERERFICQHGNRFFAVQGNNHCSYWEEDE